MPILFTQTWDIIDEKENEYEQFVRRTYLPGMTALGIVPVGGYYIEVGFGPRITAVHTADDLGQLSAVMTSDAFKELTLQLKSLVVNYRASALEPTGRVKHEQYTIQRGVWKFIQYYDIRPGRKKEYGDFVISEHIPAMTKLDYVEITGGWNVIMGGISEIMTEFTFKDPVDIGRLIANEDFRRLTIKLRKEYVTGYGNRILRCTERFDAPRWFRL